MILNISWFAGVFILGEVPAQFYSYPFENVGCFLILSCKSFFLSVLVCKHRHAWIYMKVREYFGSWPLTNTLFETGSLFLEIVFLLSVEYSACPRQPEGGLRSFGSRCCLWL